ncbi:amidotransferase 1, exosortase A system-associated [Roseisolibacter agri]|uniref:asparagine synthase (glutamine-hydrolyzing) n=1 Tax=Roseisolibacter agri TaxID=2014610 RepID=A0AA37QDU0_9BACT|nr:amidotransferase 1, exosortase A system-associated [Roseisolibacter agri]
MPAGGQRRVSRALVEGMRDTLVHRGPDGAGTFHEEYDDGCAVGLGHRRLSIVDVAHGAQPMASDDGALQLVYNGEVYNHPTEMRALQAQGVQYHTHCDTETVLRLFERDGVRAPERLRGMFAVAIWNRRTRELFLARDRFGVKPVYYVHTDDGALYFASEIKALLEAGAVRPALNWRALPDFLANHAPSGDETLFEGVRRLPAGHTLVWRDGKIELRQYWDLSYANSGTDTRPEADLVAEYQERFREAVRIRLMADVPLGMFLSGGIDSAAITAAMSTLVDDQIKTFSVAFAEREANELHYARLVSQRYRTDHHEIVVSPDQFFDALPSLVWHEDEPIAHPSSVALNFVSRLASERVKVVLTGEGSDETLAGYNRYRATIYQMAVGQRYEQLVPSALRGAVRSAVGALPAGRVRQKLSRTILTRAADLDTLYFDNFAVFARAEQPSLLTREARARVAGADPYAAYHAALARTDARTLLDRLLYADTKTYLHELLMKQDQMSMAASIESRVPFLDHPFVEWVSTLPASMKLRGVTTKHVLRQAMANQLPPEILSRKKMGFPVPVGAWFRGAHRPLVDEYVLGERALARGVFEPSAVRRLVARHQAGENHSERLWALVTFEMWQRIFLDGEGAGDVSRTLGHSAGRAPALT